MLIGRDEQMIIRLAGLKDDYFLLSERPFGLQIFIGKKRSNILIFHPIEEPCEPEEMIREINEEEKSYLFDKLNHQRELVVYIRKLPLIKSWYTLIYNVFDDALSFIFHSMHNELLEFMKEKAKQPNFTYSVVKDGIVKEVPYF